MRIVIEDKTLTDIHPSSWRDSINLSGTVVHEYRNLLHFKNHVSRLTQIDDNKCGISYRDALDGLLKGTSTINRGDYDIIKNRVKEVLVKRGIIAESVYESYKYDVEGELWDAAKVIAEDPACFLVPNTTYTNYFYELYVNISYPYYVTNEEVVNNMAKILATIELLEREHIYCKISLVFPVKGCSKAGNKSNFLSIIPLFSHKDVKSIETMSSVLNDRLLRKFYFAILEDTFKENLSDVYGIAVELPETINVGNTLDEVEFCKSIIDKVIVAGER